MRINYIITVASSPVIFLKGPLQNINNWLGYPESLLNGTKWHKTFFILIF